MQQYISVLPTRPLYHRSHKGRRKKGTDGVKITFLLLFPWSQCSYKLTNYVTYTSITKYYKVFEAGAHINWQIMWHIQVLQSISKYYKDKDRSIASTSTNFWGCLFVIANLMECHALWNLRIPHLSDMWGRWPVEHHLMISY